MTLGSSRSAIASFGVAESNRFDSADQRYLDLLKGALTASLYPESSWERIERPGRRLNRFLLRRMEQRGLMLFRRRPFDRRKRESGEDWPLFGYTMVGHRRLDNIRDCLANVISAGVAGDFIECGVWRGGASIYARAVLDALGESERTVWLADSFAGMPDQHEADKIDPALAGNRYLVATLGEVQENFRRFGLLSDRVCFIQGWFSESLPKAQVDRIAVLRLDADYYSSTMDSLRALYDKVSVGGFVIVDDYNVFTSCRRAIAEFLAERSIDTALLPIDESSVFWRKASPS